MNYIDCHNIDEAWRRGFWTGLFTGVGGLMIGWVVCAVLIATKDVQAQELGASAEHVEPISPRAWLFQQATQAALKTVSDTEYAGCLGEPKYVQRCEAQDVPAWKKLTGVVVVKLPQ